MWHAQPLSGTSVPYPLSLTLGGEGFMEERIKRLKKARGQGEPEVDSIFWIWQEYYTPELTAAMAAYIRPAYVQTSQHSGIDGREAHKPTPSWEQLAVDAPGWEIGFICFEGMSLVGCPHSSDWPHSHTHIGEAI